MTDDGNLRLTLVREFFQNFLIGNTERRRENLRTAVGILYGVCARKHPVRGGVARKQLPVPVDDLSPASHHGYFPRPLVERKIVELVLPYHLNIEEARKKNAKNKGYRQKYGK